MKFKILFAFVFILLCPLSIVFADLNTTIEHYYKSDTSGSYPDSVGSSDGTISGATYTANGKINGAYSFTTNDYVSASGFSISTPYSISLWAKPASTHTGMVFSGGGTGTNRYPDIYFDSAGGISFGTNDNDVRKTTGASFYSTDTWYHIVAVSDGASSYLYVNGNLEDSGAIVGSAVFYSSIRIGSRGDNTLYFDGIIDEVGVWDRALVQTDVTNLYNNFDGLQHPFTNQNPLFDAPTIDKSTYNVTSAISDFIAWRTDTTFSIPTIDETPTVIFNISLISNCSIGVDNLNYTSMISANADTECSTSETTEHSCTIPTNDPIVLGVQNIYIACFSINGTENVTSTSGPLSINLTGDSANPSSITNLENQTVTNESINWNWTNPTELDFNNTILFLNDINIINLSNTLNNYTATGLSPSTEYNLTIHTEDNLGNVNDSDVTNISTTTETIIIPTQPENLTNGTLTNSSVILIWNNTDDNANTAIFQDSVNIVNVTLGTISYEVTGLTESTEYNFTIKAYNESGINTTITGNNSILITTLATPILSLKVEIYSGVDPLVYAPNWSKIPSLNSTELNSGNFTINLTEYHIKQVNETDWLFNLTNNGTGTGTVVFAIDRLEDYFDWNCSGTLATLTNTTLFSLSENESNLFNCTMNLNNANQTYENYVLIEDNFNLTFNYSFNII